MTNSEIYPGDLIQVLDNVYLRTAKNRLRFCSAGELLLCIGRQLLDRQEVSYTFLSATNSSVLTTKINLVVRNFLKKV